MDDSEKLAVCLATVTMAEAQSLGTMMTLTKLNGCKEGVETVTAMIGELSQCIEELNIGFAKSRIIEVLMELEALSDFITLSMEQENEHCSNVTDALSVATSRVDGLIKKGAKKKKKIK